MPMQMSGISQTEEGKGGGILLVLLACWLKWKPRSSMIGYTPPLPKIGPAIRRVYEDRRPKEYGTFCAPTARQETGTPSTLLDQLLSTAYRFFVP